MIRAGALLALSAVLAAPAAAASDPLAREIEAIRARGCGAGGAPALRREPALDRAAASIAAGSRLRDATLESGYRAQRSVVLEASGAGDAAIAAGLAARACGEIADPGFRDYGLATRDGAAWVLLAAPLEPPAAGEAPAVGARVLALVNEARSAARRCGRKRFEAATPLSGSAALDRAALAHARDMAARSRMEHKGSDGSTPAERATRAGYGWRRIGENVAAGQPTPEQAVAEWLKSPRHCANLMDPAFTEMGVGFAADARSVAGIYWAQVFGTAAP